MARFTANPTRRASYERSSFQVQWDGENVPGVSRVSGLTRQTDVVADRGGTGDAVPTAAPGLTNYDPIVLERGRTHDDAFEAWANKVYDRGRAENGAPTSLGDYEKDVRIALRNAAGQVVMAFLVYRAWPSSYTALSTLDASESGRAVERLVLQHTGWERDPDVTEPTEPTYEAPERARADEEEDEAGPAFDLPAFDVGRWRSTPNTIDRWRASTPSEEGDENEESTDER